MTNASLTVKQLRDLAKELNITGRWDMTKSQLIEAIDSAKPKAKPAKAAVLFNHEPVSLTKGAIVSCIIPDAPIDYEHFDILLNIAKSLSYKLCLIPIKWGHAEVDTAGLTLAIQEHLCFDTQIVIGSKTFKLGSNLNINANALAPLTSVAGFADHNNMVIPHPVMYQTVTASVSKEQRRILSTTGTICKAKEAKVQTRVSALTAFHSVQGALILTDSAYPVVFYPLDNDRINIDGTAYTTKTVEPAYPTEYVYLPDMHLSMPNSLYLLAQLADIRLNKAKNAVGGDMLDCSSMNHHERSNLGYFQNRITLTKELCQLRRYVNVVNDALAGGTVKLIHGNHEDFCNRFFSNNLWLELNAMSKADAALVASAMSKAFLASNRSDAGFKSSSLIPHLLTLANVNIEIADNRLSVGNTILGLHGNEYLANKAGGRQSNHKFVFGHTHVPGIDRNVTHVGYGGFPEPAYQDAISKSLPAHCFVSAGGKRTLKIFTY
jgi:hypothetical protein